jgi:hypothetical protein
MIMKKGTFMLAADAISRDRNVIKKVAGMVNFSPCNRTTEHVESKNKSDTSNNGGNWKHPQIIHKIPDELTKSRTTEHSHTVHCTHTAEGSSEKYVTWEITFHIP